MHGTSIAHGTDSPWLTELRLQTTEPDAKASSASNGVSFARALGPGLHRVVIRAGPLRSGTPRDGFDGRPKFMSSKQFAQVDLFLSRFKYLLDLGHKKCQLLFGCHFGGGASGSMEALGREAPRSYFCFSSEK
jgi:hypothetical protein